MKLIFNLYGCFPITKRQTENSLKIIPMPIQIPIVVIKEIIINIRVVFMNIEVY